ncbi:hypothetical protein C1646_764877 [Rhizophagus diaphanus]|nr:hypothetical protein C1646_764877 [Rhizophagus diaphanus] [Rhizophagus sp. MUCL 43196]
MVTDQNNTSDAFREEEFIRYIEKLAQIFELNEQNAEVKGIKRLERYVGSLKIKLEDLDECVDREIVVDLIQEIVPTLISEKGKSSFYSPESSGESDSVEIIEKDEVILEIRRRLIVDCTFVNEKEGGSEFPAVQRLQQMLGRKYKPEYDIVLGNDWLVGLGYRIDKRDARYWENNGEVIITKFFKHYTVMDNLDLSEYYDSEYSETESEYSSSETESESESFSSESEDEVTYVNDVPPPMIMDTPNDFITNLSDFLRQDGDVNNNFISAFLNGN